MSLTWRENSGWFPFGLIPYEQERDATEPSYILGNASPLFEVPIPLLTKAWWLAKTIDWSVDLTYAYNYVSTGYSDSGTITGSGTVGPEDDPGAAFGDPSLATPPALRSYMGDPTGVQMGHPCSFFGPVTMVGTVHYDEGSGLDDDHYNYPADLPEGTPFGLDFRWFRQLAFSPTLYSYVAWDEANRKAYTRMELGLQAAYSLDQGLQTQPNDSSGWYQPVEDLLTFKIDGVVIPTTFSLYTTPRDDEADGWQATYAGSIEIEIKTFWTP